MGVTSTPTLGTPSPSLDNEAEQVVATELVRLLAVRLFFSSRTSILGYGALAFLLRDVVALPILGVWVALLVLSEGSNCLIEWKLLQSLHEPSARRTWLRILPFTVLVTGILWGTVLRLPGITASPLMYMMALLFLIAVAVLSVHNLCFDHAVLSAFTTGLTLPLLSEVGGNALGIHGPLAFAAIVFLVMIQLYARSTRNLYVHDLRSNAWAQMLARQLQRSNAELSNALEQVRTLATLDHLTQCLNRRALMETLDLESVRRQRYGNSFGIILLDLDHFKSVNDMHGHGVGDAVLVATSQLLRSKLRANDCLARWGGEEFLCVLVEVDQQALLKKAQQLCEALAQTPLIETPVVLTVTGSFGIAVCDRDTPIEQIIEKADQALYRAKKSGRNRVCD